jgi:hypothetical protein
LGVFVTKRDAIVLYVTGIISFLIVGTLWVLWRLESSWFGYRPLTISEDIILVLVSAVGLALLGLLVLGCLALGRRLDRGRRITTDTHIWNVGFIVALAVWVGLRVAILRLEAMGEPEGFHTPTIITDPAIAVTIGCLGALALWFKGTRGVALLMLLYVLLFAAWIGGWFSPLLSWLGAR